MIARTSSARRTQSHREAPRRGAVLIAALATLAALLGCGGGGLIAQPPSAPPACTSNCPPPLRTDQGGHLVQTDHFDVWYFDPYSLDSSDSTSATMVADDNYGTITVQFFSNSVANGLTARQLLDSFEQQNLDPNKFTGLQNTGAIRGAEIGYVAGAGDTFGATVDDPSAPNTPVFIEIMAATRGTTGIVFAAISPLDPQAPDPSQQTDAQGYDQMVNSLLWR